MKKIYAFTAFIITFYTATAQDEGVITKKARIGKDMGAYLNFGPSFTLGKNIGDYNQGINVEIGFVKRLNRLLSVGPAISYVGFNYDPEVTSINGGEAYVGKGDPNLWTQDYLYNGTYDYGYILTLEGGDLSFFSLGVNLKLNFIPIKDKSIISVYAFVKPFISFASRTEVSGSDTRYTYEIYEDKKGTSSTADDILYYNLNNDQWYADGYTSEWGADSYEALKEDTQVTGGIFLGPGIELFPAKRFSGFLQASFGYTLPVSFISTSSYDNSVDSYTEAEFPMVKKGFPSVNIQVGVSYNF